MNVIFDIGNVICRWNAQELVDKLFDSPERRLEALNSIILHGDWIDLDKGLISVDQAVANALSRSSLEEEEIRMVYRETSAALVPNFAMVDAVRYLKSCGYPLYVLSNMQKHTWIWLSGRYDFWNIFDGIVVSYAINMVKPDTAIYEYITGLYSLDPAESIFLDDMKINIDAARDFGMTAIHVVDVRTAILDLYARLGVSR